MRILKDIFNFLILLRKISSEMILCFIAQKFNRKSLYLTSFFLAPISTIRFLIIARDLKLSVILNRLGPIYIKFGQTLSTRPDLIGSDIAQSLMSLQDKLDPFTEDEVKKIIKENFKENFDLVFKQFNYKPVAAASIAQVHKAVLHNGESVAVKLLRPNIKKIYERDISLLYSLARIGNIVFSHAKRLKLIEAVKVFEDSMKFELDLINEAAACSELQDNLSHDENVIIPKVYWDYTTHNVLVLEWINGVSIYNTKALEKLGLDKKELVKRFAITFLNQSFRDGFFHADLHPGNILVQENGNIAFVDFGIIGKLSDRDRLAMAEVLYCLLNKNYKRVAEIHVEIDFVPKDIDIMAFALACRAVTEPIIGKPTNQVFIGHLIESLLKITSEFGMKTQPQLILLQKTILVVEGIGKILAPEVNMWNLAEPWIKKWATKNLTYDAKIVKFFKEFLKNIDQKITEI